MRTALVVPAAGRGERLGADVPKALVRVHGEALLTLAVRRALSSGVVDVVVVVAPAGAEDEVRAALTAEGVDDLRVVTGGTERQDSVRAGLEGLDDSVDVVLVHDAARCLTPPEVFVRVVAAVRGGAVAVVPVVPVSDTVKRVAAPGDDVVVETVDRSRLVAVQTPQGFTAAALRRAHEASTATATAPATDDAAVLEALGLPVRTVPGDPLAFKVTRPLDLVLADAVLASPAGAAS